MELKQKTINTTSHEKKVDLIARQFSESNILNEKVKVQKGNVSHVVPYSGLANNQSRKVNISSLNEIIHIDQKDKTCIAESGISFSDLVKETLKYNLIPYLVPELKTITIGGAVSGCTVESMSYKYGGFFDSCLEIEIVTPTGEVITCSAQENPEIFNMLHGSFGTIATITRLKFKLLEAKPFVKINYLKFKTFAEFHEAIHSSFDKPGIDFIDGIIHGPESYILCTAAFVDEAPYTSDYTGINIFYKSTAYKEEDYLTITDYLFRYDTECHWLSRDYGLESLLPRLLLGKHILGSTNMLKISNKYPILKHLNLKPPVIVDLFLPDQNFEQFFGQFEQKFNYFPIWIVPYKMPKIYDWINPDFAKNITGDLWIDIAIYGMKQRSGENSYKIIEEMLLQYSGLKTLISHNYYDEETFWKIYNREKYFSVKSETDPNNILNDIFNKTKSR
jgi:FAD/FMN-containing dehydrogenase